MLPVIDRGLDPAIRPGTIRPGTGFACLGTFAAWRLVVRRFGRSGLNPDGSWTAEWPFRPRIVTKFRSHGFGADD